MLGGGVDAVTLVAALGTPYASGRAARRCTQIEACRRGEIRS